MKYSARAIIKDNIISNSTNVMYIVTTSLQRNWREKKKSSLPSVRWEATATVLVLYGYQKYRIYSTANDNKSQYITAIYTSFSEDFWFGDFCFLRAIGDKNYAAWNKENSGAYRGSGILPARRWESRFCKTNWSEERTNPSGKLVREFAAHAICSKGRPRLTVKTDHKGERSRFTQWNHAPQCFEPMRAVAVLESNVCKIRTKQKRKLTVICAQVRWVYESTNTRKK